jgi:hypothetical protein
MSPPSFPDATFCRCCDHKGATLTVVLSESGHIFGGFAGASWTGQNTFRADEGAFLFGLRVEGAPGPIKLPIKAEQVDNAVYDWAGSGPGFGSGHDLIIASGANSNSKSHGGGLGTSFTLPPGGGCVIACGAKCFVVCQDSFSGVWLLPGLSSGCCLAFRRDVAGPFVGNAIEASRLQRSNRTVG